MLEEAERKASKGSHRGSARRDRDRDDDRRHRSSFRRPDRDSDEERSTSRGSSYSKSHNRQPGWRKQTAVSDTLHDERKKRELTPEELKKRSRSRSPFSPPKPEAVEKTGDLESEEEEVKPEAEAKVLTDQEMNALNAKIIKAELMSNTVISIQIVSFVYCTLRLVNNYYCHILLGVGD